MQQIILRSLFVLEIAGSRIPIVLINSGLPRPNLGRGCVSGREEKVFNAERKPLLQLFTCHSQR